MCGDLCPVNAISFVEDKQGFWYPNINEKKCIRCNLCKERCPALNKKYEKYDLPQVYAAWSEDDEIRISSTSGGAFWVIASNFIKNDGVVVGCEYTEDWKAAKHVIIRTINDLEKIKGSKYFQSDTEGIYGDVKKELVSGKQVIILFNLSWTFLCCI